MENKEQDQGKCESKYTYEMYSNDKTGKEFRTMEIHYNRAK